MNDTLFTLLLVCMIFDIVLYYNLCSCQCACRLFDSSCSLTQRNLFVNNFFQIFSKIFEYFLINLQRHTFY